MQKRTAKSVDEVRVWIETIPHHLGEVLFEKAPREHVVWGILLRGHTHQLRVPQSLWQKCYTKSGGNYDTRMYRWDHDKEYATLFNQNGKVISVAQLAA